MNFTVFIHFNRNLPEMLVDVKHVISIVFKHLNQSF